MVGEVSGDSSYMCSQAVTQQMNPLPGQLQLFLEVKRQTRRVRTPRHVNLLNLKTIQSESCRLAKGIKTNNRLYLAKLCSSSVQVLIDSGTLSKTRISLCNFMLCQNFASFKPGSHVNKGQTYESITHALKLLCSAKY